MAGWKFSRTVLLFLAMALGLGAIGALLAAPASPAVPIWYSGSSMKTSISTLKTAILVVALVAIAPFAYLMYRRIRSTHMPVPQLYTLIILVILLLLVGFVALVDVLHPGGLGAAGNGTGLPTGGTGTQPPNGQGQTGSGPPDSGIPALPTWVLFAVVAIAAIAFVALAGPWLFARKEKAEDEEEPPVQPIREELEHALRRMESEPWTDPRAIIQGLYARLLLRVDRVHGDTVILTPREIAGLLEQRFHVRARGARELTRIFEEARYSTAPLSPGSAEAMRRSLGEALDDLRQATPTPGR